MYIKKIRVRYMNKKIVLGFSGVLIGVIIHQTITIYNIKHQYRGEYFEFKR